MKNIFFFKILNKRRDISCSWVEKLNVVKMSVLPNLIYRLSAIPKSQNPSKSFCGHQQSDCKVYGSSLVVQWLGLGVFTAMDLGSIPGRGTKIL